MRRIERCIKSGDVIELCDRLSELQFPTPAEQAVQSRLIVKICGWLQEPIPDEPACKPCACQ